MDAKEKDTRKLAGIVNALFAVQSSVENWTKADDAINEAAVLLLSWSEDSDLEFAACMVEAGCDIEIATNFIDVPVKELEQYMKID